MEVSKLEPESALSELELLLDEPDAVLIPIVALSDFLLSFLLVL